MMKIVQYLKARLGERSTWLLIGSGISTAGLLPWPWDLVSAVIHTLAALIPDGEVKP